MTSTPPSAARIVLGSLIALGAISAAACSGSIVSLAGEPTGDGGIPGFASVNPDTISETMLICGAGTNHPFVCCRFEDAGDATLSCGAWILTPFNPCPEGYAEYSNPVTCCTVSDSCAPGMEDSETDATMLSVIDGGVDGGT